MTSPENRRRLRFVLHGVVVIFLVLSSLRQTRLDASIFNFKEATADKDATADDQNAHPAVAPVATPAHTEAPVATPALTGGWTWTTLAPTEAPVSTPALTDGRTSISDPAQETRLAKGNSTIPITPATVKLSTGVLSQKPKQFFDDVRFQIDSVHPYDRCPPYGFLKKGVKRDDVRPAYRRIFYGALVADEPLETLEIVGAETYQVFEAMVLVESNLTQNLTPRPLKHVGHEARFKKLFGVEKVQVRHFVSNDESLHEITRENIQRQEIVKGWKELGMTEHDIGYLADVDETLTRDFLRALQECPDVAYFDYESHHCHPLKARAIGAARVFETFPDCMEKTRTWHHPDVVIGSCLELIGDTTKNIIAPRIGAERKPGFGGRSCDEEGLKEITNGMYALFSGGDFRQNCGGEMVYREKANHTRFSAYHFHNFFPEFSQIRFKYRTYGHPVVKAYTMKLEEISADLELFVLCAHNRSNDEPTRPDLGVKWKREEGGLKSTLPSWPVYFHDEDYRERKAKAAYEALVADETGRIAYIKALKEA